MKKKKKVIMISLIGIGVVVLVSVVSLYLSKDKETDSLVVNQTSNNYQPKEEMIQFLYERYNVENGSKFSIVGSDSYSKFDDSYGFYYKGNVTFKDFSDIYKSYILLDLMNYQDGKFDKGRNCYFYSLDEFKDAYRKYYGSVDDFKIDTNSNYSPRFYLEDNQLCISKDDYGFDYHKAVDTYFVNGVSKGDKIIIYERVAFLNITDKTVDFYSDVKMKNKVYSLNKSKADLGFIHQSKVVSNVLLKYQKKFPIYEYQYKKGDSTYYLESIHEQKFLFFI